MAGLADSDVAIRMASPRDILEVRKKSPNQTGARPTLLAQLLTLIISDIVAVLTAFGCLFAMLGDPEHSSLPTATISVTCTIACLVFSFAERGLYNPTGKACRELAWSKILSAWAQAVAVGTIGSWCVIELTEKAGLVRAPDGGTQLLATVSAMWLATFFMVGLATLLAIRLIRLRVIAHSRPVSRTVVIGSGKPAHDLLQSLRTGTQRVFDIVGLVECQSQRAGTDDQHGTPVIQDLDTLERMIREDAIDTILIALPWSEVDQIRAVAQRISMAPVDVYVYLSIDGLDLPISHLDGARRPPLLIASSRPICGCAALLKRTMDVILSLLILVIISPVFLGIAAAIKVTSQGPILFRQRRLGYNNRPIEILKFRSMYTHLSDLDAKQQACRNDKRVTPLGAWLRRTSLDELPQLFNVLRGDMSLVGPRPHALATTAGGLALEEAVPVYASRHRVKPGITGWAQVNGHRGALDSVEKIVHRVNHDLYYIENWSILLDLKILWRTLWLVFADHNAF